MSVPVSAPGFWRQVWWQLQPVRPAAFTCGGFNDLDRTLTADCRAFVADSYPRNHTFTASGDHLLPSRKLAVRVARLSRHYPQPLRSFVDLSCSKGFFVFHAAMQPGCERALGVDLDEQCLNACQTLNSRFSGQSRTTFARTTLQQLADRIDEFGGPFQVALLVNTYQYLILGSEVAPPISQNHREVFQLLRRICSGRLIFHNRLSAADLQTGQRERARCIDASQCYERETIHQAAEEFFRVRPLDPWSRRPVWLLDAR